MGSMDGTMLTDAEDEALADVVTAAAASNNEHDHNNKDAKGVAGPPASTSVFTDVGLLCKIAKSMEVEDGLLNLLVVAGPKHAVVIRKEYLHRLGECNFGKACFFDPKGENYNFCWRAFSCLDSALQAKKQAVGRMEFTKKKRRLLRCGRV